MLEQGVGDRGRSMMYLMLPPLLLHSTHSPPRWHRRGGLDNNMTPGTRIKSLSLSFVAEPENIDKYPYDTNTVWRSLKTITTPTDIQYTQTGWPWRWINQWNSWRSLFVVRLGALTCLSLIGFFAASGTFLRASGGLRTVKGTPYLAAGLVIF